ncbi:NUDIX hydrolase [Amphritea sp. HPY]|uniref:NUDIX hydrolase n=1 Tax=Amphritea sp. HPY TaxID=3421652 RepID=UPI003D7D1604
MRLLKSTIHPELQAISGSVFTRQAARGIILDGEQILLLYTERYHDYTLPGGGIDEGEELRAGLIRELQEETGAKNIRHIQGFGLYEEYRPWHKHSYDIVHMESYCFRCTIDEELGATGFESHEIENGMKPVWINIHDAIAHNEETMATSEKKGMSIERETFLLKLIVEELLA